jgi:hypothetical protein
MALFSLHLTIRVLAAAAQGFSSAQGECRRGVVVSSVTSRTGRRTRSTASNGACSAFEDAREGKGGNDFTIKFSINALVTRQGPFVG